MTRNEVNRRACGKALKDAVRYGTGITRTGVRKWWNPLRYIKGHVYQKQITLKQLFQ